MSIASILRKEIRPAKPNHLYSSLVVAFAISVALASTPAYAASTIVVPRDFPTIQAAVNAAAPGDTLDVRNGIYTEELVIAKDLNLRGAGIGATIIRSPATLTQYAADVHGLPFYAVVRIAHGAHVQISGLTVSGPLPCGFVIGIVVVQSANLELTDARVSDMLPTTTTCSVATDRGVQFGLGDRAVIDGDHGTTASGRVTGVVVDTYSDEGLVAAGPFGVPPTSVTFADNVIIAGVPQIPVDQVAIDVFLNAVATVTGNTVAGGLCTIPGCGPDPISDFQAIGIFVGPGGDGTQILDNHISDSDIGIAQLASPNCCTIAGNILNNNRDFGIVIFDGDGSTSQNTIISGQIGIGIVAADANTVGVLHGDKIKKTSVAPVKAIECCGFTATAIQDGK